MHASLFGVKSWLADNVQKYFLAPNAKSEMLNDYKPFFLTLLFLSLQLSDKCDWKESVVPGKYIFLKKYAYIWQMNEWMDVKL